MQVSTCSSSSHVHTKGDRIIYFVSAGLSAAACSGLDVMVKCLKFMFVHIKIPPGSMRADIRGMSRQVSAEEFGRLQPSFRGRFGRRNCCRKSLTFDFNPVRLGSMLALTFISANRQAFNWKEMPLERPDAKRLAFPGVSSDPTQLICSAPHAKTTGIQ